MIYHVMCKNYRAAASLAIAFGKAYGTTNINSRRPTVKAGEHEFIFEYNQKKYENSISAREFVDKYFDVKKKGE